MRIKEEMYSPICIACAETCGGDGNWYSAKSLFSIFWTFELKGLRVLRIDHSNLGLFSVMENTKLSKHGISASNKSSTLLCAHLCCVFGILCLQNPSVASFSPFLFFLLFSTINCATKSRSGTNIATSCMRHPERLKQEVAALLHV